MVQPSQDNKARKNGEEIKINVAPFSVEKRNIC